MLLVELSPTVGRLLEQKGRRLRYFRHPYLHAGRDTATKEALERFLVDHGYRIAPVTVDALSIAISRAVELFADRAAWQRVQRRAMTRDVSWQLAADQYRTLYEAILDFQRRDRRFGRVAAV